MKIDLTDKQLKELKDEIRQEFSKQLNEEAVIEYVKNLDDYQLVSFLVKVMLDEERVNHFQYSKFKKYSREENIICQIILALYDMKNFKFILLNIGG
jgi:predicted ribosome-associated RNA-binding protein Tma20